MKYDLSIRRVYIDDFAAMMRFFCDIAGFYNPSVNATTWNKFSSLALLISKTNLKSPIEEKSFN